MKMRLITNGLYKITVPLGFGGSPLGQALFAQSLYAVGFYQPEESRSWKKARGKAVRGRRIEHLVWY